MKELMSPFNRTSANQTPEATALSNPGNLYGLQVLFVLSAGSRLPDSACGYGCKAGRVACSQAAEPPGKLVVGPL